MRCVADIIGDMEHKPFLGFSKARCGALCRARAVGRPVGRSVWGPLWRRAVVGAAVVKAA